jgi:hypothetical protein
MVRHDILRLANSGRQHTTPSSADSAALPDGRTNLSNQLFSELLVARCRCLKSQSLSISRHGHFGSFSTDPARLARNHIGFYPFPTEIADQIRDDDLPSAAPTSSAYRIG